MRIVVRRHLEQVRLHHNNHVKSRYLSSKFLYPVCFDTCPRAAISSIVVPS
jgi:hypothetical protein